MDGWITSDIKDLLNQRKRSRMGMEKGGGVYNGELKKTLRQAKVEYKKKVERQLENNNTKELWRGMRTITGYRLKNSQSVEGDDDRANTFNRFDSVVFPPLLLLPPPPPL